MAHGMSTLELPLPGLNHLCGLAQVLLFHWSHDQGRHTLAHAEGEALQAPP